MALIQCNTGIEVVESPDNLNVSGVVFKTHPIVSRNEKLRTVNFIVSAYASIADANEEVDRDDLNGNEVLCEELSNRIAKKRYTEGLRVRKKHGIVVTYDAITTQTNLGAEIDLLIQGLAEKFSLDISDFTII